MEVSVMRYTLVAVGFIVLAMSGLSLGESGRNNEATNFSFNYELVMDITNQIYNDSLLDPASADYKILLMQVSGALYSIYGCNTCKTYNSYQKVSAMTFSNQTGTVLVKATVVFRSRETNANVIKTLFMKAIENGNNIAGLELKPEFPEAIPGSTPTPSPTTPTTTTATVHPTIKTTIATTRSTITNTRPTIKTTTATTHPTPTTTNPTNTTANHPINTTITPPTNTTTIRPTTTTTTTTTRPKTHHTAKCPGSHSAASSFFHQHPITLTSFLRFSLSSSLFFLIRYYF